MVQRFNLRDKGFKWAFKPFNLRVQASNLGVEGFEWIVNPQNSLKKDFVIRFDLGKRGF